MPLAVLIKVTKAYPGRIVLDAVDFQVDAGQRVGLVGANGAGKTTILKILARELEPDSGELQLARGSRMGYVRQTDQLGGARTLEEALLEPFAELLRTHERMEELAHAMETDSSPKILEEWGDLQHAYDAGGGYAYEAEMKAVARGLGFAEEDLKKRVATMSGGERSRAALARELLVKPNLLLLDEPTNHIDISGIEWLEEYLLSFPGAVVVVSHDRYFLDRVTNRTVEVDNARCSDYGGGYSWYVEERERRLEAARDAFGRQQKEIAKTEEYIRRFGAGQRASQARGRKRRLDRLERLAGPQGARASLRVRFGPIHKSALSAIRARGLAKGYGGRMLFQDASFLIERGERVGIIGPNGSGKSTLLKILLGREKPDAGDVVLGNAVEVGYYDQDLSGLNRTKSVADEVWSVDITLKREQLQSWLALFLFPGDAIHRIVGTLSGGEQSRVVLAKLLLRRPNVLVLDEPTNHLDIPSRAALEDALDGYDGTIVTVSHDRYFLDRICDRMLAIEAGTVHDFRTDYTGVLEKRAELAARPAAPAARKTEVPKPAAPAPTWEESKEARKRAKRIERIQEEIAALEAAIGRITAEQGDPALAQSWSKLAALEKDKAGKRKQCDALFSEWQELEGGGAKSGM
ncbi:MAG: ABC-F family ATP-binding cassette domain-containing protein [Candidatus Brocadiae bacterium]|nr:ABC-F family ATP-binding cassette domain-containing protein [Candidatus Brocadiia bacterium]